MCLLLLLAEQPRLVVITVAVTVLQLELPALLSKYELGKSDGGHAQDHDSNSRPHRVRGAPGEELPARSEERAAKRGSGVEARGERETKLIALTLLPAPAYRYRYWEKGIRHEARPSLRARAPPKSHCVLSRMRWPQGLQLTGKTKVEFSKGRFWDVLT